MRCLLFSLLLLVSPMLAVAQPAAPVTIYETSKGMQTPTYDQIVTWWSAIDKFSKKVTLLTKGPTDAGFPLHLALVSQQGYTSVSQAKKDGKTMTNQSKTYINMLLKEKLIEQININAGLYEEKVYKPL